MKMAFGEVVVRQLSFDGHFSIRFVLDVFDEAWRQTQIVVCLPFPGKVEEGEPDNLTFAVWLIDTIQSKKERVTKVKVVCLRHQNHVK